MFGARIELFKLFGIPIRLDTSWFIVAALMVWSLAAGVLPHMRPGLAPTTYWAMGAGIVSQEDLLRGFRFELAERAREARNEAKL